MATTKTFRNELILPDNRGNMTPKGRNSAMFPRIFSRQNFTPSGTAVCLRARQFTEWRTGMRLISSELGVLSLDIGKGTTVTAAKHTRYSSKEAKRNSLAVDVG